MEINRLKNVNDTREQQLKELKSFTEAVNNEIIDIVGTLGWTVESVTNLDTEYFICPYDPSHRLTEESLNDHLTSCQWKVESYGKLDVPLSEPTLPEDSSFSIKFDEQLQLQVLRRAKEQNPAMQIGIGERLVPRTSDRLLTDFTSDERKALYDYTVANTAKPDIGHDIADISNLRQEQKEDKELSFLELLVQERNLKRRRAKHRGVHTNKKSQIEILREVINQQMEIYVDYISGQNNSEQITDAHSSKTDESNCETTQDRAERLYKIFHSSPRNYDDMNSGERNDHYYRKKDDLKRERSEERSYHRSRDRSKRDRYSHETYKKYKYEHRRSSHSRERKSHKKDKHRSKDKHKDKYDEKKHKSRNHDKSPQRYYSTYSDHKRKDRDKEY